jgi:hypothetical protein
VHGQKPESSFPVPQLKEQMIEFLANSPLLQTVVGIFLGYAILGIVCLADPYLRRVMFPDLPAYQYRMSRDIRLVVEMGKNFRFTAFIKTLVDSASHRSERFKKMVEIITTYPVPFIVVGALVAIAVGGFALLHVPFIGRAVFGNLNYLS